MHIGEYGMPSPSDGSTWMQSQEQIQAKIHWEQIPKVWKSKENKDHRQYNQTKMQSKK